ncbi:glycosyl hydrolases family 18-domain-containing protein [Pterulicium gracile]|uniref:Glycosyl hydrolases family 18-domain-containing protein n=1 Tax=Pterulicium gracile TaxID=1884261 RepID=A0A5C3QBX4_9AGAR|nr:glycosyl hydrolases family 18-domain-containing protein [Pterula gracilis]
MTVSISSEAKAAMSGKIVSVAAPTGYWFLKGFEIDKVVTHVDYINMMSYDFHGAWDLQVDDENGTAKPHTSSLDIMNAISLYTRAKVDLSKVNLPESRCMAWYGRTYAVGSCKGTACKFSSGGTAGKCTGESSIKSQTEIWDEIKTSNIKPTYDTKTHTYWYNNGNSFVTYDDTDSWKHKTDLAGKYCFGGTFVWSLDLGKKHDPPPTKPDIDTKCDRKTPDSAFLSKCLTMVKNIKDTDQVSCITSVFDLGADNKDCTAAVPFAGEHAVRPFCSGGCCLNIAMNKASEAKVRGAEIKQAALQILGDCHGANIGRREVALINGQNEHELEKRLIPIPTLVTITGWAVMLFEGLMTIFFMDSEEDQRGEYVTKAVSEARATNPEYNMIMVHPKHVGYFEEPCWRAHYEFDRPIFGTIGYELYYVRKGNFTIKGDGGYLNWAYSGYFEGESEDKFLKIFPPGNGYGRAGPFTAYTNSNTAFNGITVSLSSDDGCGTSLGVNNGDKRSVGKCEVLDTSKARRMAEGRGLPEGRFVDAPMEEVREL